MSKKKLLKSRGILKDVFTKEKDVLLINFVREHKDLYPSSHVGLHGLASKHILWKDLSLQIGIPVDKIKKRWKHFRDHYSKIIKSEQKTCGWKYYKSLSFLLENEEDQKKEHIKGKTPEKGSKRKSRDSGNTDSDNSQNTHEPLVQVKIETIEDPEFIDVINQSFSQACKTYTSGDVNPKTDKISKLDTQKIIKDPLTLTSKAVKTRGPSLSKYRKQMIEYSDSSTESESDSFDDETNDKYYRKITKYKPFGEKSHVHKFFENMANIVTKFPAGKRADARFKVCQIVSKLETKFYSKKSGI